MPSQVNSDNPPSSASVVMLSAPDTQNNPQDVFHTPPDQASHHSSDVNVVPQAHAGSQVFVDSSDISVFLDYIKNFDLEFSEESPVKKLKLGFGEDFLAVNDDDSCREIPMEKNSVPEENAVGKKSSYEVGEGSGNVNRSSVEVGEASDLRYGPLLHILPDSIRCRLEKGVASGLYEGIKSFTVFDVLKALANNADEIKDDGLTLLETAKRSDVTFPRPSWWPDDMKSELFNFDDEDQRK